MTDPAGGAPSPQEPAPQAPPPQAPPPQAPPPMAPPPQQPGGSWQSPPPAASAPPQFQMAPVAAGPAPGIVYADTVTRVIAYIIDVILFFVVGIFIVGFLVLAIFAGGGFVSLIGTILLAVIGLAGSAIYFIYCWTKLRASLGQKVLGLETVNAADGATLTQPQAIRRWAFLFGPTALGSALGYAPGALSLLGPLVGLLAFIYTIYLLYTVSQNPKRQGYHDVQAATVVVKRVA
jgi:RDD family